MKYLVVSDIHGSLFYASKIIDIMKKERVDKVILLGDLYYHGPRNNLPEQYNPMEVCKLLNSIKDKLYCIKGNCDAEVDEMISEFDFNEYNKVENIDVLVYGHFHTGFIKVEEDVIYVNSGSLSLPKNNTKNSYLIIDKKGIYLKDLEMNIIDEIKY